jgi:hypothetical protein
MSATERMQIFLRQARCILSAAADGRSVQISAGNALPELEAALVESYREGDRVKRTIAMIEDFDRHGSIERTVGQELRRALTLSVTPRQK